MKLRPLKWYQKLTTSKGRRREGRYLVEGIRQVRQVVESSSNEIEEILAIDESFTIDGDIPVRYVESSQMKQFTDSETVPEVVAVAIIPEEVNSESLPKTVPEKVLLLEDVQDPGNVGTLIRSAAAFGYDLVLLTDGCADPFSPKVVRSTAGALLGVSLRRKSVMDLVKQLKDLDYKLITADINGGVDSLSSVERHIFALGNEGNGVSDHLVSLSDGIYTIPFNSSRVESLNVAIAGSIGMAETYRVR